MVQCIAQWTATLAVDMVDIFLAARQTASVTMSLTIPITESAEAEACTKKMAGKDV